MVPVHTLCTHQYWNQHLQRYRRHTDTVYWYWNTSIKKSCVHYFVTVIAVFALDDCFNYPRLLLDCCGVQVWQKAPLVYLQQSLTKPKKTKVHFDELIKQYTSPSPTAPTGPLCDDSSQTWSERQKRKSQTEGEKNRISFEWRMKIRIRKQIKGTDSLLPSFHNCVWKWDNWKSKSKLAYLMKMTPSALQGLNPDGEEKH